MENWIEQAAEIGISLSLVQIEQFKQYKELLLLWNQKMNLTAVRNPDLIGQRHFLDSLICATVMGELNGRFVIDVGSGAGFPGLPLKLLFPDMRLTLVESVQKKTRFLEAVVEELHLSNVQIISQRAEQLGQSDAHREKYDWAIARAVAELRVLAEYLLPLCQVGGHMLAQKGMRANEETAVAQTAIKTLGGSAAQLIPIKHATQTEQSFLVVVKKVEKTALRYPRRVGIPTKRPL